MISLDCFLPAAFDSNETGADVFLESVVPVPPWVDCSEENAPDEVDVLLLDNLDIRCTLASFSPAGGVDCVWDPSAAFIDLLFDLWLPLLPSSLFDKLFVVEALLATL